MTMIDNSSLLKTIHYFWFGNLAQGMPSEDNIKKWFGFSPDTDAEIKEQFGDVVEQAANGELDEWRNSPQGAVVLTILFDQFPRNIFRRTERAFAYDGKALQLAKDSIAKKYDRSMHFAERLFCYMPFIHTEDESMQHKGVVLFQQLVNQASGEQYEFAQHSLKEARKHLNIIIRFGRFPHRNEVLGRVSTEEEMQFLAREDSRFGQ